MRCTQHVFREDDICFFATAQRVIFVAEASIVRGSFSCVEIACNRVTLGASVVVFVSGFDTRETRVSTYLSVSAVAYWFPSL
jgi:hypothetical protein